jgi:hypothetical protein
MKDVGTERWSPLPGILRAWRWVRRSRPVRWFRKDKRAQAGLAAFLIIVIAIVYLLMRDTAGPETVRAVAAGDMACDPDDPLFLANSDAEGGYCRHAEVSEIAAAMNPDVLLGLGDYQYELPTADAYRDVYGPTWGRLRNQTIPALGNQEYKVHEANTFTEYFGERVRDPQGYWSEDVGRWHVVVLNSNCTSVTGGCLKGSPQQEWLAADLAANKKKCVVATWHHPRWSSGLGGSDLRTRDLYRTLYDHRVELVLSGHDADYERFSRLDPQGQPDPRGVTQFVVGVGGQAHYAREDGSPEPELVGAHVDYEHSGVLELVLMKDRYRWAFHALGGAEDGVGVAVTDQGEAMCF